MKLVHREGVGIVAAHFIEAAQRPRRDDQMIFGKADDDHAVKKALHHRPQRRQIDAAICRGMPRDFTAR